VLATISAHPNADVLSAANGNADVILQTIYFNLLSARPAWTAIFRVDVPNLSSLTWELQRRMSQKYEGLKRQTHRSKIAGNSSP
jgi:hypothetical protein